VFPPQAGGDQCARVSLVVVVIVKSIAVGFLYFYEFINPSRELILFTKDKAHVIK
jgi:hypothetical protein